MKVLKSANVVVVDPVKLKSVHNLYLLRGAYDFFSGNFLANPLTLWMQMALLSSVIVVSVTQPKAVLQGMWD